MKKFKKVAVGIRYSLQEPAPRILFKTRDKQVDRLLELASLHQVTVLKDENLGSHLYLLPENSFVPEEYFEIMATILAVIYNQDRYKT